MKVVISKADFDFLVARAAAYEQYQDKLRATYDRLIKYKSYETYLQEVRDKIPIGGVE
jgi:hypothetical protein